MPDPEYLPPTEDHEETQPELGYTHKTRISNVTGTTATNSNSKKKSAKA